MAVIRVGPAGIDVRPVIDLTKIGVTILLSGIGSGVPSGEAARS